MFNTEKLNALRDDHDKLRDLYAGLMTRARKAQAEATELRTITPALSATPAQRELASRVLAMPPAELLNAPPAVMTTLGLTPKLINACIDAQRRADSIKKQADAMLSDIHTRGALLAKLNEWARANT